MGVRLCGGFELLPKVEFYFYEMFDVSFWTAGMSLD